MIRCACASIDRRWDIVPAASNSTRLAHNNNPAERAFIVPTRINADLDAGSYDVPGENSSARPMACPIGVVSPYANAMSIGFTVRGIRIPQTIVSLENLSKAIRVPRPSPSNVSVMRLSGMNEEPRVVRSVLLSHQIGKTVVIRVRRCLDSPPRSPIWPDTRRIKGEWMGRAP